MSFAEQMVAALEAAMLKNPMTLSVSVAGGQTIQFASLADRDATLERYRRQIAIENGSRPRLAIILLDGQ